MRCIKLLCWFLLCCALTAAGLSAGITGGIVSNLGVNIDNTTLRPVSTTDITHRAVYAGVNTVSQTAADVALLGKDAGNAFKDNLRSNIGSQAQAIGASAVGAAYTGGEINYEGHKLAHAALGGATGALISGKPIAGAVGAVTAEAVGESAFTSGVDPNTSASMAKVSGAASELITGDVNTAANTATTAAENNLLPAILGGGMLAEAYWISQIEEGGGSDQSLRKIGRQEDSINKFAEVAIAKGIDLSYKKYPDATMKVLETLSDVADAASATVKYS